MTPRPSTPPGVTVRAAVRSAPRSAGDVRLDVAGFLGLAERGPTQEAVRLTSWNAYQTVFGGHVPGAFLSHAVQGFFANGGEICWVVRLATERSHGSGHLGCAQQLLPLPEEAAREGLLIDPLELSPAPPPADAPAPADPRTDEPLVLLDDAWSQRPAPRLGATLRRLLEGAADGQGPSHRLEPALGATRRALLTATSPGPWGEQLRLRWSHLDRDRITVRLGAPGVEPEVHEDLRLDELVHAVNGSSHRARQHLDEDETPVTLHPTSHSLAGRAGSRLARALLQLVVPLPPARPHGAEAPRRGRPDQARLDLLLTFDGEDAWDQDLGLAWLLPLAPGDTSLGLVARGRPLDDPQGATQYVLLALADDLDQLLDALDGPPTTGSAGAPSDDDRRAAGADLPALGPGAFRAQLAPHQSADTVADAVPADRSGGARTPPVRFDVAHRQAAIEESVRACWRAELEASSTTESPAELEPARRVWQASAGSGRVDGLTLAHFGAGPGASDAARLGLRQFDEIEEIGLVAAPDLMLALGLPPAVVKRHEDSPGHDVSPGLGLLRALRFVPPAGGPAPRGALPRDQAIAFVREVQRALLDHCDRHRDRFAVLDCPPTEWSLAPLLHHIERLTDWPEALTSERGALYYPWLVVDGDDGPHCVPPCGHVAGTFAQVESAWGIHEAPANLTLAQCLDAALPLSSRDHANLNDRRINVILNVPGRGVRVLGARTLAEPTSSRRFLNVRRLIDWVIRSLEQELAWTVFEPLDQGLVRAVAQQTGDFLTRCWRRGMLAGTTPERAFQVRCEVLESPPRLLCELQLRPAQTAEAIVLRLLRQPDLSSVFELQRTRHG